ncbi:MAG: TIGR04063 family PEP-CTERM/XrtA system glycosyltransferase [Betaproteobacteria bacterium]
MLILHILDHSLPLHSGYAFRTIAILREQRARGWDTIHVTTPRHGPASVEKEEADGWTFHRTALAPSFLSRLPGGAYLDEMRASARRIIELIERYRPDVLHAHSPVLNALPAIYASWRTGVPVVYEVRALWEDGAVDHGTTTEGSVRYRVSRALETYALRKADHVTTICEGLRGEITARGIPDAKVTVIPNAVDTEAFQLGSAPDVALRARLGLENSTVLGFAGSFYGYEGLDLLVEALAALIPRRPDLRLLLLGGGPQEAALKALAAARGVSDRIVFTGRIPQREVQHYYDLIDLLVYPRKKIRLTELVTPLKPLEAMAQGRVLVASDVGGHRELIRDGETGYLFPAGDVPALTATIDRVLSHREQWDRVREQGRRFVESERTWARSIANYERVYARLLAPAHEAVRA